MMDIKRFLQGMTVLILTSSLMLNASHAATESVLPPGAKLVAGDASQNEFYILGKDDPMPTATTDEAAPVVKLASNKRDERENHHGKILSPAMIQMAFDQAEKRSSHHSKLMFAAAQPPHKFKNKRDVKVVAMAHKARHPLTERRLLAQLLEERQRLAVNSNARGTAKMKLALNRAFSHSASRRLGAAKMTAFHQHSRHGAVMADRGRLRGRHVAFNGSRHGRYAHRNVYLG